VTEAPHRYGQAPRGVSAGDVERAADALLRAGERPTIERVREKLGSGSPNTINPLLDAWWKRLSARLDSGPAALHRLPEPVAHAAEALWMQALDEGRRRAAQEKHATTRALATDKQTLEVRSHVLSLRENELESRLRDREQRQAALEAQLQVLTTLLSKEQATRDAQARRIGDLEQQLLGHAHSFASKPSRSKVERTSKAHPRRPRPKRATKRGRPAKPTPRKKPPGKKATTGAADDPQQAHHIRTSPSGRAVRQHRAIRG
jgi:septal ring factor EnvC (AmiA/AmiB activator)